MNSQTDPQLPTCRLPEVDGTGTMCWRQFLDSTTGLVAVLNRRLRAAHRRTLFDVLLLGLLARSDCGSARMRDLADALVMKHSRVAQQVRRLEAQGLVCCRTDPNDRRSVLVTITAVGRARLEPAIRTYAREIRKQYLNQLSRQQMIALGDSCRRISSPPSGG